VLSNVRFWRKADILAPVWTPPSVFASRTQIRGSVKWGPRLIARCRQVVGVPLDARQCFYFIDEVARVNGLLQIDVG
jgi:hypothetical protein